MKKLKNLKGIEFKVAKNEILIAIRELEIGETLCFLKSEWKPKSAPGIIIPGTMRDGKKFSTKKLLDDSGWATTRIQ